MLHLHVNLWWVGTLTLNFTVDVSGIARGGVIDA